MRTKPLILLILIVSLPLVGLTWLGVRVARDDEAALQHRFEEVFAVQLRDIDRVISRHFETLSAELRATARRVGSEPDEVRSLIRESPQVRQVIVLDGTGLLLHPDPMTPLSLSEREFLHETQELIRDRDLIHASNGSSDSSQRVAPQAASGGGRSGGGGAAEINEGRRRMARLVLGPRRSSDFLAAAIEWEHRRPVC